jgi:ABC-type multidrug transport system ATPase subunit
VHVITAPALVKNYDGFTAVNGVDFAIPPEGVSAFSG